MAWAYTIAAVPGAPFPLPYLEKSYFEVWSATTNNRALATLAAETEDTKYTMPGLGYGATRYFWVRAVDESSNTGEWFPVSATGGVSATSLALLTNSDIDPFSLTGDVFAADTILASRMVLAERTNLIPDPDLNDAASWTLGTTWSIVNSPIGGGGASTNINSARVLQSNENVTGLASNAYRGDAIPAKAWLVKQGESYTVSFYSRTVAGGVAKGTISVYARFKDLSGAVLSETQVSTTLTDEYTTATTMRTGIVTIPAGAAYMDIRVRRGANSSGQSQNQFWVWGLNVRRAMDANLYVDGQILGRHVAADTMSVDKLEIGARKFTFEGILFEYNSPATNRVAWTAGTIRYIDDAGANQSAAISAGSTATWSTGVIYIYWVKGATALSSTTTIGTAVGTDRVVLASYKGGKLLAVTWGKATLDGSLDVKIDRLITDRLRDNAITDAQEDLSIAQAGSIGATAQPTDPAPSAAFPVGTRWWEIGSISVSYDEFAVPVGAFVRITTAATGSDWWCFLAVSISSRWYILDSCFMGTTTGVDTLRGVLGATFMPGATGSYDLKLFIGNRHNVVNIFSVHSDTRFAVGLTKK